MANKKTNKDFFNEVVAIAIQNGNEELKEWAENKIKKLEDGSANRKPTKTQVENEALKETIVKALAEVGKPVTVTELIATGKFDATITNQKVTALLGQLIKTGEVVKTTDKKKALFEVKVEA